MRNLSKLPDRGTVLQYWKLQKHLKTKNVSPIKHEAFLIIRSLLDAAAAINLISVLNDSLVSKARAKTFYSVSHFTTTPSNKMLGKIVASVQDLQISRVIVLVGFTSIPQRLHQSPMRAKSRIRDDTANTWELRLTMLIRQH